MSAGAKNKRIEGEFCEHKECANCREISVGPEKQRVLYLAARVLNSTGGSRLVVSRKADEDWSKLVMWTILYILLVTIFIIALDVAYSLFRTTGLYKSLRDSLARFSDWAS